MPIRHVTSKLSVKNICTMDVRVFGMKIKPGKEVNLFKGVRGLTESRVVDALNAPDGELYTKIKTGKIAISECNLGTFENDPGFTILNTRIVTTSQVASHGTVLLCDASSEDIIVTLPLAANVSGRLLHIKKIDDSLNTITIVTSGSDKIDGEDSFLIEFQYVTRTFLSSGNNYYLI